MKFCVHPEESSEYQGESIRVYVKYRQRVTKLDQNESHILSERYSRQGQKEDSWAPSSHIFSGITRNTPALSSIDVGFHHNDDDPEGMRQLSISLQQMVSISDPAKLSTINTFFS